MATGGLNQCITITFEGSDTLDAISVMLYCEVFHANIASERIISSSFLNNSFFTSIFSDAASITSSASLAALFKLSKKDILPRISFFWVVSIFPFLIPYSSERSILISAFSRAFFEISYILTSKPAVPQLARFHGPLFPIR